MIRTGSGKRRIKFKIIEGIKKIKRSERIKRKENLKEVEREILIEEGEVKLKKKEEKKKK